MPEQKIERLDDNITIHRPDRKEIMFTTYREDYWDELSKQTWRLDNKGYPICSKLGALHRYIMGKWYGEEALAEFTNKGYVVDHLDNQHNNCRISNLEFLKKDFNTSKGQWLDKQVKELELHFALAIYKDFKTGCFQITIGMNDSICRKDNDGNEHHVASVKFLYTKDYPIVIKDAEMMLLDLERQEFKASKYNACAIRIYDSIVLDLKDDEKEAPMVIRNGVPLMVIGTGKAWISKVAPDRDWQQPVDGKVSYQIFEPRF